MITRLLLLAIASLLLLSACGDATAKNEPKAKVLTRADCLAMKEKQDKIDCMKTVLNKRKSKLNDTRKNIEKLKEENENLLKGFEKGVLDKE